MPRWSLALFVAFPLWLAGACSTVTAQPSAQGDAGGPGPDLGAPTTTALDVVIGGVARTLDRAQFGETRTEGGTTLHLEAHEGGAPECPTASSPSPKRTLVVSGLPEGAPGEIFTQADGVTVALLDFTGDQLAAKPATTASAAKVTVLALEKGARVAVAVTATFAEGTAEGRLSATYCASLSE